MISRLEELTALTAYLHISSYVTFVNIADPILYLQIPSLLLAYVNNSERWLTLLCLNIPAHTHCVYNVLPQSSCLNRSRNPYTTHKRWGIVFLDPYCRGRCHDVELDLTVCDI